MQYMTMNTTHQLVADHRAALGATARRGRLRRMLARTAGIGETLDLGAIESTETATPALILPARSAAVATERRIDKVA